MLQAYTITSLNINTITSELKIAALQQFLFESGTDIALLQEVATTRINIPGFVVLTNVAVENSTGTAILVREGIPVSDIETLESGRGMGVTIFGVTIINLYAPSGSSRKAERAKFFKEDILYLLRKNPQDLIIAGDFNCVLNEKDQYPNFNYSHELNRLVSQMKLRDTWEVKFPTLVKYTYFTSHSGSRIDRIYMSRNLEARLLQAEITPVSFSDHSSAIACVNLEQQPSRWFRNQWNMNVALLTDEELESELLQAWELCSRSVNNFPSALEWWTRRAKPKLRKVIISFSIERSKAIKNTMEFYYKVLRDLYDQAHDAEFRFQDVKRVKAKLLSLKRQQLEGLKIKSKARSVCEDETAALYHLIKHNKNRRKAFVEDLRLEDGTLLTTQQDILRELYRYYSDMYGPGETNEAIYDELFESTTSKITSDDNTKAFSAYTNDDLFDIVRNSPTKKSPGPDGLPIEFYKRYWNIIGEKMTQIVNEVLEGKNIPSEFKECKIVLIPKNKGCKKINNFRPISLLNSDYKIIARALNKRIMPLTAKLIGQQQTCAYMRTILQTAALYRDVIALASTSTITCGLLFIDFSKAFDRVNHQYLLETMKRMGFTQENIAVIRNVITGMSAKISVNCQQTRPIEIKRGVPQGSPLSMLLFVLSLEPLLRQVQDHLTGINICGNKTAVGAYADDVGIIVRNREDVNLLEALLRRYCSASDAQLNPNKSKFLSIRGLEDIDIEWVQHVHEHKTLGTVLTALPLRMITTNWRDVAHKIRGALIDNNHRNMDLYQRVKYINVCILSKAYYVAQILPLPKVIAKDIMSKITNFLWKGDLFRVDMKTVTLDPLHGGIGLTDISTKAIALYIKRTNSLLTSYPDSITAKLFEAVRPESLEPPINVRSINYQLRHIKEYYLEVSYLRKVLQKHQPLMTKDILDYRRKHEGRNKIEAKYTGVNWDVLW